MLDLFKTCCVFINKNSVFAIKPRGKGTHTNEIMMVKMFYLYWFARWTNSIWWAIENNYLHVNIVFEFAVVWIRAIRNKVEIIFSSKNHLHYCSCWYGNSKCILRTRLLCSPPQSAAQPLKYQCCPHIETSQLVCSTNQLTWFLYGGNTGT